MSLLRGKGNCPAPSHGGNDQGEKGVNLSQQKKVIGGGKTGKDRVNWEESLFCPEVRSTLQC